MGLYNDQAAILAYLFNSREPVQGSLISTKLNISLKTLKKEIDYLDEICRDNGIIIRVEADEISRIGRPTQGVRIMKLKDENVNVMATALTPHVDEEELEEGVEGEQEAGEEAPQEAAAPAEE